MRELCALVGLTRASVVAQLERAGLRPARTGLRWLRSKGGAWVLRPVVLYDREVALTAVRRKRVTRAADPEHPGQRRCSRCGEFKEYPAAFAGARNHCRPCAREHARQYAHAHRAQMTRTNREYRDRLRGRGYVPRGGPGPGGVPGAD